MFYYKHTVRFLLLLILALVGIRCSMEEKTFSGREDVFFMNTHPEMQTIVQWAKAKEEENPYVAIFKRRLGTPQWNDTEIDHIENATYYFVPVYHPRFPKIIHVAWVFRIDNSSGKLTQAIRYRGEKELYLYDQEGVFDLLSYRVFGKGNATKLIFKDAPQPESRMTIYVRKCTRAYIGAGENTPESNYEFKGEVCKEYPVWIPDFYIYNGPENISMPEDYNAGGGGGGGGGYTPPEDSTYLKLQKAKQYENFKDEPIIKETLQKLVEMMKQDVKDQKDKDGKRREWGCYIYYDMKTGKYLVGKAKYGKFVKGEGTNGSLQLGNPSTKYNGDHLPPTAVPVSSMHTHTPLSNEKGDLYRKVGPSKADQEFADKNDMEHIVYDYIGEKNEDGIFFLKNGHKVDDPMKVYIVKPKQKKKK